MAGFIDIFRGGDWVTRERARLVAFAVLAATLICAAFFLATAHGFNDRLGRPLGTDFSSFYAAGTLVLDGQPAGPYALAVQHAREQAIFGSATPFYIFPYPPFFLLIAGALALLSYPLSLVVWQGASLALYLLSIRVILFSYLPLKGGGRSRSDRVGVNSGAEDGAPPGALRAPTSPLQGEVRADPLWLLVALGFPAVFVNLGHGQNGFLTAGLFGFALAALQRRPLIAGVLFGLLAYKPQFGLMIPLVLLATGQWRVIAAAAATVATLALTTLALFGADVWQAFIASTTVTRTTLLEYGDISWFKMQSAFAALRLWHAPMDLAYFVQGAVTLAVAVSLVQVWRSRARYPLKAAALPVATLLATPFCFDYDLMLLAPAIAFLAVDVTEHGVAPWQKSMLAALWIVPLVARTVAGATLIPLTVPLLLLAFAFMLRCAMAGGGASRLWHFAARPLK